MGSSCSNNVWKWGIVRSNVQCRVSGIILYGKKRKMGCFLFIEVIMSKIIYVSIAILIYIIINLFITIKKNTKILHFAGSVLFLQFFLLSAVNSHFITLSEYSVCEYIFLFCMIIYAVLVYFLENKRK